MYQNIINVGEKGARVASFSYFGYIFLLLGLITWVLHHCIQICFNAKIQILKVKQMLVYFNSISEKQTAKRMPLLPHQLG